MLIKVPFCNLHAMSSDLLKGEVRLTFTFSLNETTMKLREKFAMLEILGTPVDVEIKSPQAELSLNDDAPTTDAAPETFKVGFAKAASDIYNRSVMAEDTVTDEPRKAKFKDQAQLTRERKPRGKGKV